jgi:hypothetical protein
MPKSVIAAEPVIRLCCFLGVLLLIALWEILTPRRPQAIGRFLRWPNNLGLVVLDTLIVRLLFPFAGVGMAPFWPRQKAGVCSTSLPCRHGSSFLVLCSCSI